MAITIITTANCSGPWHELYQRQRGRHNVVQRVDGARRWRGFSTAAAPRMRYEAIQSFGFAAPCLCWWCRFYNRKLTHTHTYRRKRAGQPEQLVRNWFERLEDFNRVSVYIARDRDNLNAMSTLLWILLQDICFADGVILEHC